MGNYMGPPDANTQAGSTSRRQNANWGRQSANCRILDACKQNLFKHLGSTGCVERTQLGGLPPAGGSLKWGGYICPGLLRELTWKVSGAPYL
jgi:hypothetical protein